MEVIISPRGTPTIVMKIIRIRMKVEIIRANPIRNDFKKLLPEISDVWDKRFGVRYNIIMNGKRREKNV